MTYEELIAALGVEAAMTPEEAVDIVLALATEAYENGFKAGYAKAQTETPTA